MQLALSSSEAGALSDSAAATKYGPNNGQITDGVKVAIMSFTSN